jgi:hypothetical protein
MISSCRGAKVALKKGDKSSSRRSQVRTRLLSTIGAALLCALSVAEVQGPPQGGPPRGGPPQGMQRGPQMPPPNTRAVILMMPSVQAELQLSQTQVEQLRAVIHRPPPGGPAGGPSGGPGGGPPQGGQRGQGGPPQGGPPGGPDQRQREQAIDGQVRQILSQAQYRRYEQLSLQHAGPVAIGSPEIAEKVGVSGEQLEQIRQIARAAMPPPPGPGQGPGRGASQQGQGGPPPNPEEMRRRMHEAREKAGREILAVLTPAQREKWNSLLGAQFTFDRP